MHNEFTLVKHKRNKRKKQPKIISANSEKLESDHFDTNTLNRKLSDIIHHLEISSFSADLIYNVKTALDKLNKHKVHDIICYGLGKFSESLCSLHQLAAVVFLQRSFGSVVQIFDPVFSLNEINFLKTLNFSIIEGNEEGKRLIAGDKLTLLFLPHCPKQLVNNFLWANWSYNLRNCIIIGNSFTSILDNNAKRVIDDSANYISKAFPFCEEIPIKDNYDYSNVFNDTSIHFFNKLEYTSPVFEAPAEEPKYSEDIEFVTREIKGLELKK